MFISRKKYNELIKRIAALEEATRPENVKKEFKQNLIAFFEYCEKHPDD